MTYTITNNTQFNSTEIAFDGKPSEMRILYCTKGIVGS